jgi:hypothetical protein
MIDNLAIALTHFLLAVGLWRVLLRDDLDRDPDDPAERPPFVRRLRRAPRDARPD